MSKTIERTEMRSITSPGFAMQVDKAKYDAMKDAILAAVPKTVPGLTVAEIKARVLPLLPEELFPGGAKAGWWLKGVQLDLEARGLIARENVKPLRLHRL
ncbi:hypothetical protein ATE68_08480 [Sphingopyxis sp. H038]|uniref:DUF6958 family protein n=1 Tax=unclassified Sphingopyxis TaxID=2614943 RepID=UPI000730D953|nr:MULTISPECIES: hypothetical protein [unclassified Sphingopyxis]KTE03722.1 hypothetical protein ATE78_04890 [Sphingopyxis sp. H012]KTE09180.1 hypothetical protein ATE70_15080 [Sphingopyxis sp. H053]KTE14851.1 hypothetical protein ATE76_06590 [Sphingopyxis sp. H093]KTE29238.1 hypothetical protein ATE75_08850 [Sphingopyxis sp. H080]KTE35050.1 hypothetical protein ATE68_08480 [Sphingopyxis sp. H038]